MLIVTEQLTSPVNLLSGLLTSPATVMVVWIGAAKPSVFSALATTAYSPFLVKLRRAWPISPGFFTDRSSSTSCEKVYITTTTGIKTKYCSKRCKDCENVKVFRMRRKEEQEFGRVGFWCQISFPLAVVVWDGGRISWSQARISLMLEEQLNTWLTPSVVFSLSSLSWARFDN